MTDYKVIESILLTIKPPKTSDGDIDREDLKMWANKAYEYGLSKEQWDKFVYTHIKGHYTTGSQSRDVLLPLMAKAFYQEWIK
jgi:hypothetical protein